ncbi:MAG: helix-turn-helix domain-containing protein [Bacteroidales bacterium]|nr:helix-turn-helix domain-containing protein [Bacteroidales bacterium]
MKDVTQKELADAVGVSRQTILAIEKGYIKRTSDELMLNIANYFGVGVGDIFFTPLVQHVLHEHEKQNISTSPPPTKLAAGD